MKKLRLREGKSQLGVRCYQHFIHLANIIDVCGMPGHPGPGEPWCPHGGSVGLGQTINMGLQQTISR